MDLSKFTEDEIRGVWSLINTTPDRISSVNRSSWKKFQYPLNVIVYVSITRSMYRENLKYIKEYDDMCGIIKHLLELYDNWFSEVQPDIRNILKLYFEENSTLTSISKEIGLSVKTISSKMHRALFKLDHLLSSQMNHLLNSYIVTRLMDEDVVKNFLKTDLWFVVNDEENCVLLNSEGYYTVGDILTKDTDKFYLADSVRCTRAKLYPVIIRILHKKEYSESEITYIRNRTINFYSKYLGFEQNLLKGEKK